MEKPFYVALAAALALLSGCIVYQMDKAAAAKADVVKAAKKTVAARRKDLEDLKKAGIIDEAEFAAEVKKLEGAEN